MKIVYEKPQIELVELDISTDILSPSTVDPIQEYNFGDINEEF